MTIKTTCGSRIQYAFDFLGIIRLRFHHQAQALQLKSAHQILFTNITLSDCDLLNKR